MIATAGAAAVASQADVEEAVVDVAAAVVVLVVSEAEAVGLGRIVSGGIAA